MAEIKSTLELVMERAARMGVATPDEMRHEENLKQGMQQTAAYLNGNAPSLKALLDEQDAGQRAAVRKGMLTSLLRNLFLPRDEEGVARLDRAIKGLGELNPDTPDIPALCRELRTVATQYSQHRDQLYEQLKEQVRRQLEQILASKGMHTDGMKIDPSQEPHFKEQWAQLEADLDHQYNKALEQFKQQLAARVGI
ncbi:MAG: DUF6657 family protein [Desulfobulbus sp.]|jgi:hypothetical protein